MTKPHGWASSPDRKHIPNHVRRYVERRDQGLCQLRWGDMCLVNGTDLDHIVSPLNGGTDTAPNLRLSCRPCNAARNHATRRRTPSSRRPTKGPPGLIA